MRAELPVYQKCCCCLPLRDGLITWGYIRMISAALLFIGLFFIFYGVLGLAIYYPDQTPLIYTVLLGLSLVLMLTDIAFNIVFVIGGHKISSILLFIGFFCMFIIQFGVLIFYPDRSNTLYIIIWGMLLVLMVTDIAYNIAFVTGGHKKSLKLLRVYYIYSIVFWIMSTLIGIAVSIHIFMMQSNNNELKPWVVLLDLAVLVAQLFIQAYFILLVRSEIIKIRSNCQFRFVNTSESERMRCVEQIASGNSGDEDIHGRTYVPKDTYQFTGRRNDDGY